MLPASSRRIGGLCKNLKSRELRYGGKIDDGGILPISMLVEGILEAERCAGDADEGAEGIGGAVARVPFESVPLLVCSPAGPPETSETITVLA